MNLFKFNFICMFLKYFILILVNLHRAWRWSNDRNRSDQNNSSHSNSSQLNLSFKSSQILSASSSQLTLTSSLTPINNRPSTINFNDHLVTHRVSPNIQHRITQFLQNNRSETTINVSPTRRSLRPRNHSLNYRE